MSSLVARVAHAPTAVLWIIAVAVLLAPWGLSICFGLFLAYKLYHPYRRPARKADLSGLDAASFRIPAGRGAELDALFLKASTDEHLVLIAHEVGAFKETKLKIARRLVSKGYNVLLFDLRNHGGSSKDRAWWPMSERFTDDIEAALRFARHTFPGVKKTTLYTFSFSTFPSLYIVRRDVRQPDSIVLDSGPTRQIAGLYAKFLDETATRFVPRILRHPLFYPMVKLSFEFFGVRMLATTWPPDLSRVESDVLFIMNGRDPVFSREEIQSVSDQIRKNRVWLCAESTHLQAYKTDPDGYEKVLFEFLQESAARP